MPTYIRLTDYKGSEEKKRGFFKPENRYKAKQEDYEKILGSPIAYWVSDRVREIFETHKILGNIYEVKQGMATSDNNRFLRYWNEISFKKLGLNLPSLEIAKESYFKWFPYNKGGEFKKWYGNNEYIVNYENDGKELKEFQSTLNQGWNVRLKSREFYFKESINWSFVSSGTFGVRYSFQGSIFDVGGSSLFPKRNEVFYITSLLNSVVALNFLKIVAPTINFQIEDIKSIPIIFPQSSTLKSKIEHLTQQNIDISKEEWESRETSWDFTQNELLRILNDEFLILNEKPTLEVVYNRYCDYWREKFFQLHANEEELNRLFIDIYELQDELTPDVPLEDITILKNEAKIINGELVFQADEIMKQLISYGVGVMFGRYSLDHEGLHIADMGVSLEEADAKFDIQNPAFEADDDNIIPVLEDDYFKDDIASRFVQFVKTAFGEEHLSENIKFIEDSLGMSLRKYFVKGFYEDHIKRYKKRPIYWMVASPKKGFMSLLYMHRYQSDVFARVRNSYLTEYIAKLEAHKETLHLTVISETASNKDKKDADKKIKSIEAKLKEVIAFDREKMMGVSQNPVEIDLDDGVKVNYCKFKDILYPITGLCKK